jgi:exopolysaccharide biosynthesis protein
MLLRGGALAVTDAFELINVNNTSPRPRSAIGHTLNNIVLLVAVEGDNTVAGRLGLSLNELAQLLRELGCTDAINLDGGGSTSLIVGNQPTVRPGDNGAERPVVSAVLIKQK